MTRSLAVIQSHYIPWAGFFDLVGGCTDIVLLDSVSYSKNSYFNRNRLIGSNGPFWLTIPIITDGKLGQPIHDVETRDNRWVKKHLRSVEQSLASSPHLEEVWPTWHEAYSNCLDIQNLSQINRLWLDVIFTQLGLTSSLHLDSNIVGHDTDKNSRLLDICQELGADVYRTGPRGLNYLDIDRFQSAGVAVQTIQYGNYYPYRPSLGHADQVTVSILENLANMGLGTSTVFRHSYRTVSS
ncbi:MAG: hypothetical protein EBT26_11505 [Microbacteriaceae bacterium]|nr:hypothetical protein [Microbacteriaceae bacterium]NBS62640.1 hypothetical protein [Microbacteriaceae bacterium]